MVYKIGSPEQALYRIAMTLGYKRPKIEAGAYGDTLWVNEEDEYCYLPLGHLQKNWRKKVLIDEIQLIEQDGWLFWRASELNMTNINTGTSNTNGTTNPHPLSL